MPVVTWESLLWLLIGISTAAQAAYRAGYNAGWRDRGVDDGRK